MHVSFRYTDREYLHSRRINKLIGMPKWKSLGLALICLIPSVALVTFTNSYIALMAFTMVAAYLVVMISLVLIRQSSPRDKHDHLLVLTPLSLHETNSHSEYELKWQYFDEFSENETEFLLRRLERYISLPKRIFTQAQGDQLRTFAVKVGECVSETDAPVSLFTRIFSQAGQNCIYRFTYCAQDLIQAASDRLVVVDPADRGKTRKQPVSNGLIAAWLVAFLLVAFYLARIPADANLEWTLNQYLVLTSSLILPFVLLIGFSKSIRWRAAKRPPKVPREENCLVLLKQGFAVGNPGNVAFYEWRDIDAFYANSSCFGFKSFNGLIQVIPKRIFADETESTAFFNRAIQLHREHRRSFEEPVTAVETANPYQPPAG